MNNTEILIIRACKSLNPQKQLDSVYKRFYYNYKTLDKNLYWDSKAIILIELIDKYNPIPTIELANVLNPKFASFYVNDENNYTYYEHLFGALVSYIRFENIDRFEGFKIPNKFKKEYIDNHY